MFESLTERLDLIFKKLRGYGKLTEQNIQDGLREVRLALLEADVNYKVVKDFVNTVHERSVGQEVLDSLTPGQQLIKIVHEELTALMGGQKQDINFSGKWPVSIMLVGLQGSGKTTTAGKLALHLRGKGRRPYLVPADIYRPAAIEQLQKLANDLNMPAYPSMPDMKPLDICQRAMALAREKAYDTVIIDTAGRLHIDTVLMDELKGIEAASDPSEIILVADAMTGQDAVNIAEKFNQTLGLTGIILTKMDGDARGGAALSIKAVTQKPIKFVGVGEKLDALEPFYPDRMASRILGMGDVLTLIEKAQATFDANKAVELEKKIRKESFTLEDFRDQLQQIKKMGTLEQIIGMIPGLNKIKSLQGLRPDESELVRIEAIINSMTRVERRNYTIINGSRRRRISQGSGTSVQDVNKVLKNFAHMQKMMKKLKKGGLRNIQNLFSG
ncbi:MAG: signal recognition particle protein [Deltaproteobacteria bacterium]|nr:signal recognition particle protein [Deltaproteobacteria bacterium]